MYIFSKLDRLGLVRGLPDVHVLGLFSLAQLLADCDRSAIVADQKNCQACALPASAPGAEDFSAWIRQWNITALGFSYRLDPQDGLNLFSRCMARLREDKLLLDQGGPLRAIYFAGLPETCALVKQRFPQIDAVFTGDETPLETLRRLGIEPGPNILGAMSSLRYDEDRLAFGRELVQAERYQTVKAIGSLQYPEFGTVRDSVMARLAYHRRHKLLPLTRAHMGPYQPDREAAVYQFLDWTRQVAQSGLLDVLSIGTSQLSQSHFGLDWANLPNGGGVPLNTPQELAAVWQAARPMLTRCYAGTSNIPAMAELLEKHINMAWHALSLWWFCKIDGRGPHDVRQNLAEHLATLRFIASTGKPYEPNVAHHFSFRGADDVTSIVATWLAAKTARSQGIRHLILQVMLNTPKSTWGIADLAKARALLTLTRELETSDFSVILQPRGGLDYFSADPTLAKAQLAAVTALMDDIEPLDPHSPPIIHVVGYSEGSHLADPAVVTDSIRITRAALTAYRQLKARGQVDDMSRHAELTTRTAELLADARVLIKTIEAHIPNLYSAGGLYRVFADGFLPVPWLWEAREEFQHAVGWQTRLVQGSVKLVNAHGTPLSANQRVNETLHRLGQSVVM